MKIQLKISTNAWIHSIHTIQYNSNVISINIRRGDGIFCHVGITGVKKIPRIDGLTIKGYRIITKIKRKHREFQKETNKMLKLVRFEN